jgi:hypothetical protein
MPIPRPASPRLPAARSALILALLASVVAACSTATPSSEEPTAAPSSASPWSTPAITPEPTATPAPTPRYTNEPDAELAGLIPTDANGVPVIVAPFDEFALTPGDIGRAYGEIGDRFASLALAYVEEPRATLYAMRVDGEDVSTEDLEPHLATAGRYVGISGLDPDPWEAASVAGTSVWVRPEDNATAAGTMIYTWSSGEFVFLLIGVDDTVNRAIIQQLPGEPAPTPRPSPSPSGSGSPAPSSSGG